MSARFVWADMPVQETALTVRLPEYGYFLPKYRDSLKEYKK